MWFLSFWTAYFFEIFQHFVPLGCTWLVSRSLIGEWPRERRFGEPDVARRFLKGSLMPKKTVCVVSGWTSPSVR